MESCVYVYTNSPLRERGGLFFLFSFFGGKNCNIVGKAP